LKLIKLLEESHSKTGLFIMQQTTAYVENTMDFFKAYVENTMDFFKSELIDAQRFAYNKFNY